MDNNNSNTIINNKITFAFFRDGHDTLRLYRVVLDNFVNPFYEWGWKNCPAEQQVIEQIREQQVIHPPLLLWIEVMQRYLPSSRGQHYYRTYA